MIRQEAPITGSRANKLSILLKSVDLAMACDAFTPMPMQTPEHMAANAVAASQIAKAPCAELSFAVPRNAMAAGATNELVAAQWRNRTGRATMQTASEHVIICKLGGSSMVTRTVDGRTERKRPRIGSFTVVPAGSEVQWEIEGEEETLHLYVSAAAVERFVAHHAHEGCSNTLQPRFAVDDPWLLAYSRLFRTELTGMDDTAAASLFLSESEHLLLRHLMRRQADREAQAQRRGRVSPLRPFLLRRVTEYIEAHLHEAITLADLARLACMSPDHFLRAFAAATGSTPGRYAQQRRLETAAQLLQDQSLAVGTVASRVGFRSASHFSVQFRAHFGCTPLRYRAERALSTPRQNG